MQQTIAKGDALQRFASVGFIVGAVLVGVFNALYPRVSASFDNLQPHLQRIVDAGSMWQVTNLLLAVGIWDLMIGLTGVYRSISAGAAAMWARLGYYGVIIGTTLWTILFGLNIGLGRVLEQWVGAAGADKAYWFVAASSVYWVSVFLFGMTIIVYWMALAFMGIGMAMSKVYPKWLGWGIIILGGLSVLVVGVPMTLAGPSEALTNILFAILAALSVIWALVVGIRMARKAW